MTDIVEALRNLARQSNDGYLRGPALEAAAEIERNALDSSEMSVREVRSAIYVECLTARVTSPQPGESK